MTRIALLVLPVFLLTACTGETFLSTTGDGEGETNEYPEFDGAYLQVLSPTPSSVYLLGEGLPLEAQIISSEGEVLEFEDVHWESNVEGELATGLDESVDLDWGIKIITATADLPNGDRLQTVIGGVRVQGRHTGIYAGNIAINVNAEFEGTPITASCLGGLAFVVDMSGEVLIGEDSSCTINLLVIGEFDIGYGVEAAVEDDLADGSIQINTGFIDVPVAFEGDFEDGNLTADFEGDLFLFGFDGSINTTRLSQLVDAD